MSRPVLAGHLLSMPRRLHHSGLEVALRSAALAYLVDYHLVPKRLTPGWEERVSGRSLAMIFGVMALSLPVRSILERRS